MSLFPSSYLILAPFNVEVSDSFAKTSFLADGMVIRVLLSRHNDKGTGNCAGGSHTLLRGVAEVSVSKMNGTIERKKGSSYTRQRVKRLNRASKHVFTSDSRHPEE